MPSASPAAAVAIKRRSVITTPSDHLEDDTVDVEVQPGRTFATVHEVTDPLVALAVGQTEADVAVTTILTHDPTHDLASRRPIETQRVVDLVQEHVTVTLQPVVPVTLLRVQEEPVGGRVRLPVLVSLGEQPGVLGHAGAPFALNRLRLSGVRGDGLVDVGHAVA